MCIRDRLDLGEIESELAQQGQVLGTMILAVSGLIFVHDHVEHPMELVLDAPMAAHDVIEAFRREGLAEEIAAGLDRRSTIDLAGSSDLSDCLQALSLIHISEPTRQY